MPRASSITSAPRLSPPSVASSTAADPIGWRSRRPPRLPRGLRVDLLEETLELIDHPGIDRRQPTRIPQRQRDVERGLVVPARRSTVGRLLRDLSELDVGHDQIALPAGVARIGPGEALS